MEARILIGLILAAMIALFLWGRWRHDMVAAAALLVCVLAGLVPAESAFSGFGHPAVITVACVLVLSNALQQSGAIDVLSRHVLPAAAGPTAGIAALTALAAVLSAFMNNVGALALLMPVAAQLAQRSEIPPGRVLMPVAFGSILGGIALWAAGVPFAGILTSVMFLLALAQIGAVPVLLCAAAWLYWKGSIGWMIGLIVWSVIVGSLDNIMRPLLIKQGADLSLLLIFAGVIGGLIAFGLVGIFVGPVVLAVAYTLLEAWMREEPGESGRGA